MQANLAVSSRTLLLALRFAACAFLVSQIVYVLLVMYLQPNYPAQVVSYQRWWLQQPLSTSAMVGTWIGYSGLALTTISAIALALFQRWARFLFLLGMAAQLLSECLIDLPVLLPGILAFCNSIMGILAGLVLALSYSGTLGPANPSD